MSDRSENTILVTGGAGFIGTNFILQSTSSQSSKIINVDKITYAGNPSNLDALSPDRYQLCVGDIADPHLIASLFEQHRPRAVINFAAESHVDRSIHTPDDFITTNIVGTLNLLKSSRQYWNGLSNSDKQSFRFIHISTDEVYGSLGDADPPFSEVTRYAPNSPYAASKAGSDHLVRAWYQTYGLPTLTLNSSNNYGPYQFPEKLIPLIIHHAIDGKILPVYGDGQQVRDWIFVEDFCRAIQQVLDFGIVGECYGVGGRNEKTNLSVVETICEILDNHHPRDGLRPYRELIKFVTDRLGHDRRYAMDCSRIERELGWRPVESFESGIRKTVLWYLQNPGWVKTVTSGAYTVWLKMHYNSR